MARTINKVELLGRVGTDPEMKYTTGGTAIVQLRLATERRRQDGEVEADWHNVVVWGKTAEAVNQYVGKGDRIYVAGRLVQNTWEGDPSTGSGQAGSGATAPRYTPPRSCSSTPGAATATAGRTTATQRASRSRSPPLPSSRSIHNRRATPSRRRATGPLPCPGTAPLSFNRARQSQRHTMQEEPKWHAPSTR